MDALSIKLPITGAIYQLTTRRTTDLSYNLVLLFRTVQLQVYHPPPCANTANMNESQGPREEEIQ